MSMNGPWEAGQAGSNQKWPRTSLAPHAPGWLAGCLAVWLSVWTSAWNWLDGSALDDNDPTDLLVGTPRFLLCCGVLGVVEDLPGVVAYDRPLRRDRDEQVVTSRHLCPGDGRRAAPNSMCSLKWLPKWRGGYMRDHRNFDDPRGPRSSQLAGNRSLGATARPRKGT